ncbi:hypothetical protein FOA52_005255 [Chlamydomonas sp. UWO 241]|nr:hypothetical protein FOA52_005255 [Chlamydomonas sp. UWO 241]
MTMTEGHLNDEEANFLAGVLGEPSGLGGILISAVHAKQATGQGGSSGKQHGGPKRSDAAGGAPPERPSVSQLEDAVADTMAAGAGPGSAALAAAAAPLARAYNEAAVAAMDGRRLPAAFELLQKAEALCGASGGGGGGGGGANGALDGAPSARDRWAAATANNLGCYYQRKAKPEAALHYLQRCAELEGGTGGAAGAADAAGEAGTGRTPDDDASTLLNLCAVLGSLGRHEQALPHAEGAVETLCGAVGVDVASLMAAAAGSSGAGGGGVGGGARPVGGSSDGAGDAEASSISSGGGGGGGGSTSDASRVWAVLGRAPAGTAGLLCMALYNRAVEMEHLGRLRPALTVYRAASALAGRLLPSSSPLRTQFARTLSAFKARLHAERVSEQQQHAAAGQPVRTWCEAARRRHRRAATAAGG